MPERAAVFLTRLQGIKKRPSGVVFRRGAFLHFYALLHKRIIKPSKHNRHGQADEQQHSTKAQRDKVAAREGSAGVPCALIALAEAAQFHCVGDRVDAVQARQNQRQQDADRIFQPLEKRLTAAQLDTARLLRLTDAVIIALDIRDVAQRDCHRITDLVGDADAVQAGGELTGVGGGDKQDRNGQCDKIFERDIEHVKQLLCGQVIPPEKMAQHRAGAVEGRALIRIKQEDKQIVQCQKHQHEHQHKADLAQLDVA